MLIHRLFIWSSKTSVGAITTATNHDTINRIPLFFNNIRPAIQDDYAAQSGSQVHCWPVSGVAICWASSLSPTVSSHLIFFVVSHLNNALSRLWSMPSVGLPTHIALVNHIQTKYHWSSSSLSSSFLLTQVLFAFVEILWCFVRKLPL